jgi:D-3-phosphoglycerate dehydrogenase
LQDVRNAPTLSILSEAKDLLLLISEKLRPKAVLRFAQNDTSFEFFRPLSEKMTFRVALTRDFLKPSGELAMGETGIQILQNTPQVSVDFLPEFLREVAPQQIAAYDAVISLAPAYTRRTLAAPDLRLSILARVGVGYDMLDLAALSERNVIVTITPDGVRRPMAAGIASFVLALAHQVLQKDRLVRRGAWNEKLNIKSIGLTGLTLGSIGLGNIGRETFHLLKSFEMRHLATDPFLNPQDIAGSGIQLVDLETLMRESDFVCVNCPLSAETRHLIGAKQLAWMKPTAFFINTSRGGIVDQAALYEALRNSTIRGAALDVFETEPIAADDPLLSLDNVIVAPHSLCWTDECFRLMVESAVQSVLTVLQGRVPAHIVNREVLEKLAMKSKLAANRDRWDAAVQEAAPEHKSPQADPA